MGNGRETDSDRKFDASDQNTTGRSDIGYRRLRSPQQHGQILQVPPLSMVDSVWKSNLEIRADSSDVRFDELSLAELQRLGRSELLHLATKYTGRYRADEFQCESDAIVMAGHQPELFHPGVWFKNFVLSNLGQRCRCTAINMVVDNDVCGDASIRYPKTVTTEIANDVSIGTIEVDRPGPIVPFEERHVQDRNVFDRFPDRVMEAFGQRVLFPIIKDLWPEVLGAADQMSGDESPRLGHVIAAGRHRLEGQFGLRTLEVPVSWLAQSNAFAIFARTILTDLARFQSIYNEVLQDYRIVHKIRSRSHPVPELESTNGWTEAPFWVWRADQPARRRLFVRQNNSRIWLSDLQSWEKEIKRLDFSESFQGLGDESVAIRPRALMTTMFSRLVLCDLFLHGIGGAKYDQLTDVMAARFFSCRLPSFLTLSATLKLPSDRKIVTRNDVTDLERQIRDLKFHPENHLSDPSSEAVDWTRQKREWTRGVHRDERSQAKHVAIEALNLQLAKFVDSDPEVLKTAREKALSELRSGEILGSREYSFCLFPKTLVDELKILASLEPDDR